MHTIALVCTWKWFCTQKQAQWIEDWLYSKSYYRWLAVVKRVETAGDLEACSRDEADGGGRRLCSIGWSAKSSEIQKDKGFLGHMRKYNTSNKHAREQPRSGNVCLEDWSSSTVSDELITNRWDRRPGAASEGNHPHDESQTNNSRGGEKQRHKQDNTLW